MKSLNIVPCGRTKSLLIALYAANNNSKAAVDMVTQEGDSDVTPYMLSNAIVACGDDWRAALGLLKRASGLNKADEAVYTATARCVCVCDTVCDTVCVIGREIMLMSVSVRVCVCDTVSVFV